MSHGLHLNHVQVSPSGLVTVTEVLLRWLFLASGGGGCLHSRMVTSFQMTRTTLGTHVHEDDTVFPLLSLQRE